MSNNKNERIQIINDTAFITGTGKTIWTIDENCDGEIWIECEHRDGSDNLFLNQTELKQLIEFLQTKLK